MNKTKIIKTSSRKITDKEREESPSLNVQEFKSLLGALLYIAVKSRPDILFAVNQISRHCEEPTDMDYKSLMDILQYLKCTKNKSIYCKWNIDI